MSKGVYTGRLFKPELDGFIGSEDPPGKPTNFTYLSIFSYEVLINSEQEEN